MRMANAAMTGTRADTSIFGNLFEFCRSPSIHSDHDRYPMMDEIIRKVSRRLKTRLGKCEAVGDLALIRSSPAGN